MSAVLQILSRLFIMNMEGSLPMQQPKHLRLVANILGVFSLIFGGVLGGRALYLYLEPTWGEVGASSLLGGGLMSISILLWLTLWLFKPKDSTGTKVIKAVGKAFESSPVQEMTKKITHMPKEGLAILGVALFAYYLSSHKKENI